MEIYTSRRSLRNQMGVALEGKSVKTGNRKERESVMKEKSQQNVIFVPQKPKTDIKYGNVQL